MTEPKQPVTAEPTIKQQMAELRASMAQLVELNKASIARAEAAEARAKAAEEKQAQTAAVVQRGTDHHNRAITRVGQDVFDNVTQAPLQRAKGEIEMNLHGNAVWERAFGNHENGGLAKLEYTKNVEDKVEAAIGGLASGTLPGVGGVAGAAIGMGATGMKFLKFGGPVGAGIGTLVGATIGNIGRVDLRDAEATKKVIVSLVEKANGPDISAYDREGYIGAIAVIARTHEILEANYTGHTPPDLHFNSIDERNAYVNKIAGQYGVNVKAASAAKPAPTPSNDSKSADGKPADGSTPAPEAGGDAPADHPDKVYGYDYIDPQTQLGLEISGFNTGKKNHTKFLAGDPNMDSAKGPNTDTAIIAFKKKYGASYGITSTDASLDDATKAAIKEQAEIAIVQNILKDGITDQEKAPLTAELQKLANGLPAGITGDAKAAVAAIVTAVSGAASVNADPAIQASLKKLQAATGVSTPAQ